MADIGLATITLLERKERITHLGSFVTRLKDAIYRLPNATFVDHLEQQKIILQWMISFTMSSNYTEEDAQNRISSVLDELPSQLFFFQITVPKYSVEMMGDDTITVVIHLSYNSDYFRGSL